MPKKYPVVHFEMPYSDNKRVAKFYQHVFGWDMQQMDEKMGNYVLAMTTDVDDKTQRPKKPGAINGGFYPKGDYGSSPHLVIAVDDIDKHIQIVKKAGGKILGEVKDIPGVGKFVMSEDSEGNRVGMLQPTI